MNQPWSSLAVPPDAIIVAHSRFAQIDDRVTSKYILNVFWGMKPEEEPMRREAAARMREQRPQDSTSLNCLPAGLPFVMFIAPFKSFKVIAAISGIWTSR
jgi:hypothetical protein